MKMWITNGLHIFPDANWDLDVLAIHPNFTTNWLTIIDSSKWSFEKMSYNKS